MIPLELLCSKCGKSKTLSLPDPVPIGSETEDSLAYGARRQEARRFGAEHWRCVIVEPGEDKADE